MKKNIVMRSQIVADLRTVLTGFLGLCDHLTQSFTTDALFDQVCYLLRSRRNFESSLHEQLNKEGYEEFVEFYKEELKR